MTADGPDLSAQLGIFDNSNQVTPTLGTRGATRNTPVYVLVCVIFDSEPLSR